MSKTQPAVIAASRLTISPARSLALTVLRRQRAANKPVQFRALGAFVDTRKPETDRAIPVAGAWQESELEALRSLRVDLEQSRFTAAATALDLSIQAQAIRDAQATQAQTSEAGA